MYQKWKQYIDEYPYLVHWNWKYVVHLPTLTVND